MARENERHLHKFAKLHQSLLHGKLPRSLHWSDVVDLIGHLGQVQAHGGDEFAFVVGTRVEWPMVQTVESIVVPS
jgi:hypothetical protein